MLGFVLLALGILSRFVIHAPNFTPVIAVAFFGGVYLNRKYAVLLPLAMMMISDAWLGFYDGILYTWLSLVLVAAVGLLVKKNKRAVTVFSGSLASALLFFVVSNLGVWATGYYTYTWQGFWQCYLAAIPFFRNTLVSTLAYSAALFGIYELVALRVRNTPLARVLLAV